MTAQRKVLSAVTSSTPQLCGQPDIAPAPEPARIAAAKLADKILELRDLARAGQHFSIAAPLELAFYEAFSIAHKAVAPRFDEDEPENGNGKN